MLLMGNLDKLFVLLMLLLGMDLYIDLDLEQHSIGLAYDLYLEGTLDEVVVGKLGREGMLDKGVVDKRIVLMEKLLLLGMEQLVLLSLLMLLVLDLLLLLVSISIWIFTWILRSWITLIRHCIRSIWNIWNNYKNQNWKSYRLIWIWVSISSWNCSWSFNCILNCFNSFNGYCC
jgi:hypothetical protein